MRNKVYKIVLFVLCIMAIFLVSPKEQLEAKTNGYQILATDNDIEDEDLEGQEDEETKWNEKERQIEQDLKDGYELDSDSDITDAKLYSALLKIANEYIREKYSYPEYSSTTIWNSMFKEIESITISNKDIDSLSGIEKIEFDKLKSLTIVGNNFSSIPDKFFDRMDNLEELNLACNNLSSIEFPENSKLRKINLSSNNLSKVNFSSLTYPNMDINVAHNKFETIKNIGFSTQISSLNLNIINNNVTDITEDYFTNPKITMHVGVQGIVSSEKSVTVSTSEGINYYKLNKSNVYAKLFKKGTTDTFVRNIADSDVVEGYYITLNNLDVGSYYVEYYDENGLAYAKRDSEKTLYKTYSFNVIPNEPTVKYEFKGKIYDTFDSKVTGKVKVYLSCEDGGETYYKVGNSDWVKGNEINCDKGGSYSITVKVIKDGVESKEKSILISTSLNVLIPDFVMLILVLAFTLVLFLIVVPFISKKWFRK